eukprot:1875778-Rhodomonas_salina.5
MSGTETITGYAMCGTEVAYGGTRLREKEEEDPSFLHVATPYVLWPRYGMSSTDIRHPPIVLRPCYGMPGTERGYQRPSFVLLRNVRLWSYALCTGCPGPT